MLAHPPHPALIIAEDVFLPVLRVSGHCKGMSNVLATPEPSRSGGLVWSAILAAVSGLVGYYIGRASEAKRYVRIAPDIGDSEATAGSL